MLPYEKNRSTFPPHQSTAAPQNLPRPTPTPIDLWKKIPAQSRACRRNAPRLGRLRSKITKQKLNPLPLSAFEPHIAPLYPSYLSYSDAVP